MGEDRTACVEKGYNRGEADPRHSSCSEASESTSGVGEEEREEELEYGPGIVNKLRTRFLSISLKQTRGAEMRRSCSMENLVDQVQAPCCVKGPSKPAWGNLKRAKSMDTLLMEMPPGVVRSQDICEEELPKPDTVKTYKRMFEPAESRRGSYCRRPPVLRAKSIAKTAPLGAKKGKSSAKQRAPEPVGTVNRAQTKSSDAGVTTNGIGNNTATRAQTKGINNNNSDVVSSNNAKNGCHVVKATPVKIHNSVVANNLINSAHANGVEKNLNNRFLNGKKEAQSDVVCNGRQHVREINGLVKSDVVMNGEAKFKPKVPPNRPTLRSPRPLLKIDEVSKQQKVTSPKLLKPPFSFKKPDSIPKCTSPEVVNGFKRPGPDTECKSPGLNGFKKPESDSKCPSPVFLNGFVKPEKCTSPEVMNRFMKSEANTECKSSVQNGIKKPELDTKLTSPVLNGFKKLESSIKCTSPEVVNGYKKPDLDIKCPSPEILNGMKKPEMDTKCTSPDVLNGMKKSELNSKITSPVVVNRFKNVEFDMECMSGLNGFKKPELNFKGISPEVVNRFKKTELDTEYKSSGLNGLKKPESDNKCPSPEVLNRFKKTELETEFKSPALNGFKNSESETKCTSPDVTNGLQEPELDTKCTSQVTNGFKKPESDTKCPSAEDASGFKQPNCESPLPNGTTEPPEPVKRMCNDDISPTTSANDEPPEVKPPPAKPFQRTEPLKKSPDRKVSPKKGSPSSTSMVFDFRGKDVVSHVAVLPAPFGCKAATLPPDEEADDFVDYSVPAPSGVVFEGENVKVGRGSILSIRNKELKIKFDDDVDSNTFVYPSESSLLEDPESSPSPSLNGESETIPNGHPPKLKANTVIGTPSAGGGLSSYTPSVLRTMENFCPGMFRAEEEPRKRPPPPAHQDDEGENVDHLLSPAELSAAWSLSAGTSDLLF